LEKKQKNYFGPSKVMQVEISAGKFAVPNYWLWFLQIKVTANIYCILYIFR